SQPLPDGSSHLLQVSQHEGGIFRCDPHRSFSDIPSLCNWGFRIFRPIRRTIDLFQGKVALSNRSPSKWTGYSDRIFHRERRRKDPSSVFSSLRHLSSKSG